MSTTTLKTRSPIKWGVIGSYAILIIFAIIYAAPMLMLVNTAFKTLPEFMKDATSIATSFNFENFGEAWEKANFPRYLTNSLIYTVSSTLIFVVTAVFVAFPIARKYVRGSNIILTLFVIALFLPPALIPQFQLMLALGLYNNPLGYILLFTINPIGMVILVNYIRSIPKELDEAAAMDGCGYFRFVISILFPLIRPAIATVAVLHAIGIWNELILPTIYLTNKDYYPITRGMIVFQGVYGSDWPTLAAAVLIMTLPMVIVFLFLQRYIVSGLTQGAVKG
ncbi:MAG: ABC transporter permease subunit [candidate division Zixibacteria bacterium]|nr:carbohydrate ABC transporter permease [candidate division Zixibacteria bacterium]NIU13410.1 carbohydrate ABC transporter permease [candidate division Zixibacteria bacterium]NIV05420.1 ABC transporter permease subunit [candidate division Zixibacteria bacterium]NIW44224.1 ABC transporter permease subunit [Gammaproteobacteria bacterium]